MDKKFISYLGNKLKTGNLNSIHLNALPGRLATRMDICQLDVISGKTDNNKVLFDSDNAPISEDFLFNNLLKKPSFQYKINFDKIPYNSLEINDKKKFDLISRKLNAIVNQDVDSFLEHGIKTFGFGFPMLVKRSVKEPAKIIKAPILIWNLDIRRSNSRANEWIIEMNEESPIYINEVLISHLSNDENIKIEDISTDFLEDNLIDETEILSIINDILNKLNSKDQMDQINIEACRTKEEIENEIAAKAKVLWSGIFGLFKTQKQSIIKDNEQLVSNFDNFDFKFKGLEKQRVSTNSSVPTDPSQEAIIYSIDSKEFKVIQGPPGTGKSQSLTAIITNTLENGKKILVVCEKKTALDVILSNLQKLELDKLCAIIDDVARDRKRIIDTVRAIAESEKQRNIFNESDYDRKLLNYNELINDFNARHHNLLKELFNGYNLQEIISEYLGLKISGYSNDRLLQDINFEFSGDEYNSIIQQVVKAKELYEDIPVEAFSFDMLAKDNFIEQFSPALQDLLFDRIDAEINFLQDIESAYFERNQLSIDKLPDTLQNIYDNDVLDNYSFNIQALLIYWQNLSASLEKMYRHYMGDNLLNDNSLTKKIKEIYSLYDNISNLINELKTISEQLLLISLEYDKFPDSMRKKGLRIKSQSKFLAIFSSKHKLKLKFQKTLYAALEKINFLIAENGINNTHNNLLEIIAKHIPLQADIDSLINNLKLCKEAKKWMPEYHPWRHYIQQLKNIGFQVISKLKSIAPVNDWEKFLTFSYVNLFIETRANGAEDYNFNGKMLDRIALLQRELKALQKYKILNVWEIKCQNSMLDFNQRNNIKLLFNHRKNSQYSRKNTLRSILQDEFELFTDIFPVILVNPVACSSILPLQQNLFELVLFDEASQLRLEDTYTALLRGKIKVISGDKHQMPPSNYFASDIPLDPAETMEEEETVRTNFDKANPLYLAESESLLEFGNSLNPNHIDVSFLDYHYRSKHPHLIDFSNVAFYGGRLIPMPEKESYKAIRFIQVDGIYLSDNTNRDEAEQIINFIRNNYPVSPDGKYPSLGIATFNMQQRNLLKDMINEECIKDEEFRKTLDLIGENEEWFVKNLENIQGDERDIIIISTTFGKNVKGDFRQNFGPINTAKGYKLLNVIITRAKKHLLVFTSIPESYFGTAYQDEILANGNKGKAVLYAYLDYCRAIESDNEAQRQSILKILQQACDEDSVKSVKSMQTKRFNKQVEHILKPYFKPGCLIAQYQLGGYLFDFALINSEGKPVIAIECDGAYWHNTELAFSHDLHRKKIVEMQGLRYYRIWSKSWWPEPAKEIDKLLDFVRLIDENILMDLQELAMG